MCNPSRHVIAVEAAEKAAEKAPGTPALELMKLMGVPCEATGTGELGSYPY